LISFYLWMVLVFLFDKIYYGFTPLWHRTSRQKPYDLSLGMDLSNVENIGNNKANLLDDIRIEFGIPFQTQVIFFC
jgi:hypothetical protein